MIKELLAILRGDSPLNEVSENLHEMMGLVQEMCLETSAVFWGKQLTPDERSGIYKKDIRVNKLERAIRKKLVTHLSLPGNQADSPYGLLLMSVIKDVERLGDYAKNLGEIADLLPRPLPSHPLVDELRDLARQIEELLHQVREVFEREDRDKAWALVRAGRDVSSRCQQLVVKLAASDLPTNTAVPLAIGSRFYKRIEKHLLNLLTSVIMPLHKLDYFDESLRPPEPESKR